MKRTRSPLSIRLGHALADALDGHSAQTAETRSGVVRSGPTLGSLAEAVLPPLTARRARKARVPRRKRYREYVLEKRLR